MENNEVKHRPLTAKQIKFLDRMQVLDYNQTAAYMEVYGVTNATARSSAPRLLRNPLAQEYLERSKERFRAVTDVDKAWLIGQYLELIKSCKEKTEDGGEKVRDRANWNKSLAQLSKLLGLDAPEGIDVNLKEFKADFGS